MEQALGSGLPPTPSASPCRALLRTGDRQTAQPVLKPEDEIPPRTRRGSCELPSQTLPKGLIINAAEGHFSAFQFPTSISARPSLWRKLYSNITRGFTESLPSDAVCVALQKGPYSNTATAASPLHKLPQLLCLVPITFFISDLYTVYSLKDHLQPQLQQHWLAPSLLHPGRSSHPSAHLFCWRCQSTACLL